MLEKMPSHRQGVLLGVGGSHCCWAHGLAKGCPRKVFNKEHRLQSWRLAGTTWDGRELGGVGASLVP